jgi:uncharacterized protein (DUF2267 family)
VTDGELTNFFCVACQCCWHLELGWVHRIDPTTCPGCAYQSLCRTSRAPHHTRPGQTPPASTADDVLADRIRSTLGPLEQRLDVPRVHVMVEGRVALLHGDVGTASEAGQIEQAVQAVPGVTGVESYLHLGLLRSDTRPSEGRREHAVSDARKRLLATAVQAGVAERQAALVVRAVLSRFAERLPDGERRHLVGHLPADVRSMLEAPRRLGHPRRVRSLPDLVFLTLVSTDAIEPATAPDVVTSVLAELHALVPEEVADVAAVLPADLRAFWQPVPAK